MKKIILLFCFIYLFNTVSFGQRIKENLIDEFTGQVRTTTGIMTLTYNGTMTLHYRLIRIDSVFFLNLRLGLHEGSVFAVNQDAALMLKLESDTILTLKNQEYTPTTLGGGANGLLGSNAMGVNLYYQIPNEFVQALMLIRIKKIRVYTTYEFVDNEINQAAADRFKEAIILLNQTKPPEKKPETKF